MRPVPSRNRPTRALRQSLFAGAEDAKLIASNTSDLVAEKLSRHNIL
jgi:hypothetical protein